MAGKNNRCTIFYMKSTKSFLPCKLLIIIAHPDDEGYLFSGTTWMNHQAGGTSTIVCATLGEKGSSHLKKPMSPVKLKALRKKELLTATKFAKVNTLHILKLPDGGVLPKWKMFLRQTAKVVKSVKPDVILSFGPDGITGHRDHQACFLVAQQVGKKYRLPVYVASTSPTFAPKLQNWLISRRAHGSYDTCIPLQPATAAVPLPSGLKRKILSHYPSQVDLKKPYGSAPVSAVKKLFAAEYFSII